MTRQELIKAMDDGLQVRWKNDGYKCYKDTFQSGNSEYRKTFTPNGYTIGIFHRDNIGMNLDPADCYIKENTPKESRK